MSQQYAILSPNKSLHLFRSIFPLFLLIHGIYRIAIGGVTGFGGYLDSAHFKIGLIIAWALTLLEIIGSLLIISGYSVRWLSVVFIVELVAGIIMVHAANGWFVVGDGTGGMEYSFLLIIGYALLALSHPVCKNGIHTISLGQTE